jgi:hypothetical protein
VNLRLVEHAAADGSPLFDIVVDLPAGGDRVIYRGRDRAHVGAVRDDLDAGRLPLADVQAVMQQVILPRRGEPGTVFIGGRPLPLPFERGAADDRWKRAVAAMEALRTGARPVD